MMCLRSLLLCTEYRYTIILAITLLWIIYDNEMVFLFMAFLWVCLHRRTLTALKFQKGLSSKLVSLRPVGVCLSIVSDEWRGLPQRLRGKKKSVCNAGVAGDTGSSPGLGRSPRRGHGNPTPVFWPGESHGQRSLVGYSPRGRKELDTTEATQHGSHDEWGRRSVTLCRKRCNERKGPKFKSLARHPSTWSFWAWVITLRKQEWDDVSWRKAEIWAKPLVLLPFPDLNFVTANDFLMLI